jgi:aminopeptidase N
MRVLSTLLLLCFALPAAAQVVPFALPPTNSPVAPAHAADLWRLNESLLKGRSMQKALTRDGGATPSMALYDVTWYDIFLNLAPASHLLTGEVMVRATVTGALLRDLDLHLADNLAVTAVRVGATSLGFTHQNGVLTATLPRDYLQGEQLELVVVYSGDPQGDCFGWGSVGGQELIWTLSEPYGARTWWPCKDLNDDKADGADIRVRVPSNLVVASNGKLLSQQSAGGQTTYYWRENYPICTYLISLAAHPYVVYSDWYVTTGGDSLEIRNYVVPAYEQQARAGYAAVPQMIAAFAEGFGEYPFMGEKYGHAHFPWGGGMEHQTCSSMTYGWYAPTFIAHELSHQWWGDMITCKTFHDIWLNEGFATWAEAYWREQSEGPAAYRDEMQAARYTGSGTIYIEDPADFGGIFDYGLSYLKASWVVHMLRGVLGDDDFFAGLAAYRAQFGYGAASTEDLQAVMEAVSGHDLGPFMQQWIHGEYYPQYEYSLLVTPHGADSQVQVNITQVQTNAGVFTMPIELAFVGPAGWTYRTVENDGRDQNYSFILPGTIWAMELDPENWILKDAAPVDPTAVPLPAAGELRLAAAPNPFNPSTSLTFSLSRPSAVELTIFDPRGRRVCDLLAGETLAAGPHAVRWDGRDAAGRAAAAGAYVARLRSDGAVVSQKLTLAK